MFPEPQMQEWLCRCCVHGGWAPHGPLISAVCPVVFVTEALSEPGAHQLSWLAAGQRALVIHLFLPPLSFTTVIDMDNQHLAFSLGGPNVGFILV